MGRYISLTIPGVSYRSGDIARLLSSMDDTVLVAIGGHDGKACFVAGRALESFIDYASTRKSRSYTVGGDTASEYVDSVIDRFRARSSSRGELSPFEHLNGELGATSVEASGIDESVTAALDVWHRRHRSASVRYYLQLPLAFRSGCFVVFRECALRDQVIEAATPFVDICASPGGRDLPAHVTVRSTSHVWLREAEARGHVGPDDADQNLARLAALASALVTVADPGSEEPYLRVDGRAFINEEARLFAAFKHRIPSLASGTRW